MIELPTEAEPVKVVEGDCRIALRALPEASVDSVVTDPPYELGFMGAKWDGTGIAFDVSMWKSVLRVLKPGGNMLAMGGTRTYHRLASAIEDAGFEIRDCLMWMYGTGFPKGQGCLKPAWEPILLARKPGKRVLSLGIDACRVPTSDDTSRTQNEGPTWSGKYEGGRRVNGGDAAGRYPANVVHDGSDEVMEAFAVFGEKTSGGKRGGDTRVDAQPSGMMTTGRRMAEHSTFGDTGTAARFFYCAKASKAERGVGNAHPTVKPLALMRWLVRLVTPPGGLVLDSFAGSGTTLLAAGAEGMRAVGIEQDAGHCAIIRKRLADVKQADGLFGDVA